MSHSPSSGNVRPSKTSRSLCQSPMAKLQILTLSAKLLSLSHLSALAPHHRPLTLLFQYVTTSARFDLNYEVRDRSRFLVGLLSSAGIGKTEKPKVMMGLDDFSRGQQADFQEDASGRNSPVQTEEKPTLTGEQVRIILFEGKGGPDDKTTKEGQTGDVSLRKNCTELHVASRSI